jgi:hypothetical protein
MSDINYKITEVVNYFNERFGSQDCFRTWVDNINNGHKYIVWCSFRYDDYSRRNTVRYRKTIKA